MGRKVDFIAARDDMSRLVALADELGLRALPDYIEAAKPPEPVPLPGLSLGVHALYLVCRDAPQGAVHYDLTSGRQTERLNSNRSAVIQLVPSPIEGRAAREGRIYFDADRNVPGFASIDKVYRRLERELKTWHKAEFGFRIGPATLTQARAGKLDCLHGNAPLRIELEGASRVEPSDTLLARVLADPGDNALRQVWADALLQRGDPRGEVIALQIAAAARPLTAAEDKHVRSILSKHATSWLGPLRDVVMHNAGLVLDRGLVSSCQIQVKSVAALEAAIGHALWAGVRSLWFCDAHAYHPRIVPFLAHPVLRSLREVMCIGTHNVFPTLATGDRVLPFTSIWLLDDARRGTHELPLRESPAAAAPALPNLRHLGIQSHDADIGWIFELPVVARLESLGLTVLEPSGRCLERAEAIDSLGELELRPAWILNQGLTRPHFRLRFTRDERGRLSQLRIGIGHFVGPLAPRLDMPLRPDPNQSKTLQRLAMTFRGVARELASIPTDAIRTIDVDFPEVPFVRAALRRFRGAHITFG